MKSNSNRRKFTYTSANNAKIRLNNILIPLSKLFTHDAKITERSAGFNNVDIQLCFNCHDKYIEWIKEQDVIFGCMFNLWDEDIVNELSKKDLISIVANGDTFKEWAQTKLSPLKNGMDNIMHLACDAYIQKFPVPDYILSTFKSNKASAAINNALKVVLFNGFSGYDKNLRHMFEPIALFNHEEECELNPGTDEFIHGYMHHKFLLGFKNNKEKKSLKDSIFKNLIQGKGETWYEMFGTAILDLEGDYDDFSTSIIYGSANMAIHSKESRDSLIEIKPLPGKTQDFENIFHMLITEYFAMQALACPIDEYLKDKGKSYSRYIKDNGCFSMTIESSTNKTSRKS